MTVSNLASGTKLSPFCDSSRANSICKFTPHYMAGDLSASQCGDIFLAPNRNASSNYGIGSDGEIICYVDEDSRAWTSSSPWNDNQAITVEVANLDNDTGRITDQAWKSLVDLATDVCHRYNFTLNFTNDSSGSLTMHKMYAPTACPGPFLESHMLALAEEVNSNLKSGKYPSSSTNGIAMQSGTVRISDPATAYALGINGKFLFTQEDIFPFMITINQNSPKLDFVKLKNFDVVGVCIDIGSYFDESHLVKRDFRNKKLQEQVEACIEAHMPYALYTTLRSRTQEEAILELSEIKLAIRKYPPQLGMWVKINFGRDVKSINDAILDLYYETFVKLGLYDQVGLYCTKEQLEKITWKNHYEKWYWWMDKHLSDITNIHNMPTPKFFSFSNTLDEEALVEPDFEKAAQLLSSLTSTLSSSYGGYSTAQELISKIAESSNSVCLEGGMCAQFVTDVYSQAHKEISDIQICWGNGIDYWRNWKSSGGTDKHPPAGSVVVGSGYGEAGSIWGHVGIVLIDGRIAENVGGRNIASSVDDWAKGMNATCDGYTGYIGWVWPNNLDLTKVGTWIAKNVNGVTSSGDIEEICWRFFINWGFTKQAAAAAIGAWSGESSLDPTSIEGIFDEPNTIGPKKRAAMSDWEGYTRKLFAQYASQGLGINQSAYYGTDGILYPGIGIAGFTGPWASKVFDAAKQMRKNWYDIEPQLEAFKEVKDSDSRLYIFKTGTDIDSLVISSLQILQGASYWNNQDRRISKAHEIYNRFA